MIKNDKIISAEILKNLGIYELRELARNLGIASPTTKKRNELCELIIKVSKGEQEKWAKMIDTYLNSRDQLKEVILLIDCRHEPGKNDVQMFEWIKSCGYTGYVIAAKADKLSKSQQIKNIALIKRILGVKDSSYIIPFSAISKSGVDEIWRLFEQLLELK